MIYIVQMLKGDKGEPGEIPEIIKNLDISKLKGERGPPGYCAPSNGYLIIIVPVNYIDLTKGESL